MQPSAVKSASAQGQRRAIVKSGSTQPTAKKVESVLKAASSTVNHEEVSDAVILDEMRRLISEGHSGQAEKNASGVFHQGW